MKNKPWVCGEAIPSSPTLVVVRRRHPFRSFHRILLSSFTKQTTLYHARVSRRFNQMRGRCVLSEARLRIWLKRPHQTVYIKELFYSACTLGALVESCIFVKCLFTVATASVVIANCVAYVTPTNTVAGRFRHQKQHILEWPDSYTYLMASSTREKVSPSRRMYERMSTLDGLERMELMESTIQTSLMAFKDSPFVAREGDVFIATFPRCGTAWIQQICKLVRNNGVEDGTDIDVAFPWIDLMSPEEAEVSDI